MVTLVRVDGGDHFFKAIDRDRLSQLVDSSADFLLGVSQPSPE